MRLLEDLIELLLPQRCAGCGRAAALLCDACAAPLRGPARLSGAAPAGLPPPWTVAAYEGPLRAILAAYKEHGRTALAAPLGAALATALGAALDAAHDAAPRPAGETPRPAGTAGEEILLTWVPSSRRARRRRGHDPLRTLVSVAAGRLRAAGTPVRPVETLRQRTRVADQAGLTARQRAANLHGALEARTALTGRRVLLADDVVTTGASLAEAARALRAAGARVPAAAAVAATPRRRP